jgi:hypothetical protein
VNLSAEINIAKRSVDSSVVNAVCSLVNVRAFEVLLGEFCWVLLISFLHCGKSWLSTSLLVLGRVTVLLALVSEM